MEEKKTYKIKRKVLTEWIGAMVKAGITYDQVQAFLYYSGIQASRDYKDRVSTKSKKEND